MSANPSSIFSRAPAPQDCSVFVQVWVDVDALQQGSTQGCYAVSNLSQESTGEGTASLTTTVPSASAVCWSIVPIDPQYKNAGGNQYFSITSIGVGSGWDAPPTPTEDPSVFTGTLSQASTGGQVNSNIVFSFNDGSLSSTVTLPVVLTVVNQ
jgi:hypothetical protein